MLKVQYQKLRLSSKGNLKRIICNGIPVLSIFALVSIISINLFSLTRDDAPVAYAAEVIGDSTASLTISGSASDETISAGRGETVYRVHKVAISGSNVRNYSLSISGDSELKHTNNDDALTSANNTTGAELPINTWGYSWEELASSTSDGTNNADLGYTAPPTNNASAMLVNNATLASSNNGNLASYNKLVFAAKFDEDKPSGNYKANVNLALTITPRVLTAYSITYNGNGNTSGTAPDTQSADLYDTLSHSFAASTPGTLAKGGYIFLGWSESSTAATATYPAGATISLTAADPTKTLYAVWKEVFSGITTMQQMTAAICATADIDEASTLVDPRDDATYTIQKYADGNCWMTQNLRITGKTVSSADSDMTSGSFSIPSSNIATFGTKQDTNSAFYGGHPDYGAYYSWYTTTAGTGRQSTSNGNASNSICPKGWKLPLGSLGVNSNDFAKAIGLTTTSIRINENYWDSLATPIFTNGVLTVNNTNWTAGGAVVDGSLGSYGLRGFSWSRTASSSTQAYYFNFTNGDAYPSATGNKYNGLTIRCVAYSS